MRILANLQLAFAYLHNLKPVVFDAVKNFVAICDMVMKLVGSGIDLDL